MNTSAPATKGLTVEMLLDAAARLSTYKPNLPVGYVFGPRAEDMMRKAAFCDSIGYQSILGVPYWIDAEMTGGDVECYYDKERLALRVKLLDLRDRRSPAKWEQPNEVKP